MLHCCKLHMSMIHDIQVCVKDQIRDYSDMAKDRILEKTERISKKSAQNQILMADRLKLVVAGEAGGAMNQLDPAGKQEQSSWLRFSEALSP